MERSSTPWWFGVWGNVGLWLIGLVSGGGRIIICVGALLGELSVELLYLLCQLLEPELLLLVLLLEGLDYFAVGFELCV